MKLSLSPSNDNTIKALGIFWESLHDRITYSVQHATHHNRPITKRTILAEVAKIYDPLGLLGPVVVTAKILVQKLWTLKLLWDESVSLDIHTYWTTYCRQLEVLNNLSFPRKRILDDADNIQQAFAMPAKGHTTHVYISGHIHRNMVHNPPYSVQNQEYWLR